MIIDVLINSCARPDIMDDSLKTFKKHVKSNHTFRYIILEDRVDDPQRQSLGKTWINNNEFDEVHFADKKMGPGFFFAPIVALCKSNYFFHLEDDNEFITDVSIDPVLDIMQADDNIVEVLLSRGNIRKENNLGITSISGLKLIKFDLFSVATGLFNTKQVNRLIEKIGWQKQLHEASVLTPMSKQLGLKKYVLGHGKKHYIHVGANKGYRKGTWHE